MDSPRGIPFFDRRKFEVAIICALEIESTAVEASFDDIYDAALFGKALGDTNAYTLGRIGQHHVVLAYLPSIGKASSAGAAAGLRTSFSNIRLSLLVGVCGAVPVRQEHGYPVEILLGDIIISTGVVQYDFGRQYDGGPLVRKNSVHDNMSRLPPEIRSLLHKSQAGIERRNMQEKVLVYMNQICCKEEFVNWMRPALEQDILYPAEYVHRHRLPDYCAQCQAPDSKTCSRAREATCEELNCNKGSKIPRSRHTPTIEDRLTQREVRIHWGLIASGDLVIKSGSVRDSIATEENVIAFEMEGAGLWEAFPTIIVKGVCDYADSHKHKGWQKFAAVTAASGAKALLSSWTTSSLGTARGDFTPGSSTPIQMSPKSSFSVRGSQQSFTSSQTTTWLVPFDQKEKLIGRSSEFCQTERSLFSPVRCARTAIEGLGGIGKSRLALEIAYSTKTVRPDHSIFWVQCSDLSSFERDCRRVAQSLNLPGAEDLSQDPKVLVKQHFDQDDTANWLLILDNADDERLWSAKAAANNAEALIKHIPRGRKGAVLVTTRNHRVAVDIAQKNIVRLAHLCPSDSRLMLQGLLEQPEILTNTEATSQLLDHLTHLPLAIVQAAAFINQNNLDNIDHYLRIWNDDAEDEIIEILSEDFTDDSRYDEAQNPVAKTWLISFKNISVQYPLAATIMSYMSCLNPKDMPRSSIPPLSAPRLEQNKAFSTLQNYAFIQSQQGNSSDTFFDMHRLVHLATRNYLRHLGVFPQQLQLVAKHLCSLLPRSGLDSTVYWQRYLPHAEKVVSTPDIADDMIRIELEELLSCAQYENGAYTKSLVHRQALVDWLSSRAETHGRRTMRNLSALSNTLRQLGRWQESMKTSEEAFELCKHVLSNDDPGRVAVMESLADAYRVVGRCDEALKLSLETVEAAKNCVFETHEVRQITIMSTLHTLSANYHTLRRWQDQENVLLEAIEVARKLTDQDHTILRAELEMELAAAYCRLEKADVAERLLLPIKQMFETRLGRLHRLTLSCFSCLADVYHFQKRYRDAELLYRQLLDMFAEAGRQDDTHVLRDRNNLAHVIHEQGRYEEAKDLQLKNIGITTQISGKDSVLTLHSLEALSWSYWYLGKKSLAVEMLSSCVKRSFLTLGHGNPDTINRLRNLQAWRAYIGSYTPEKVRLLGL